MSLTTWLESSGTASESAEGVAICAVQQKEAALNKRSNSALSIENVMGLLVAKVINKIGAAVWKTPYSIENYFFSVKIYLKGSTLKRSFAAC